MVYEQFVDLSFELRVLEIVIEAQKVALVRKLFQVFTEEFGSLMLLDWAVCTKESQDIVWNIGWVLGVGINEDELTQNILSIIFEGQIHFKVDSLRILLVLFNELTQNASIFNISGHLSSEDL